MSSSRWRSWSRRPRPAGAPSGTGVRLFLEPLEDRLAPTGLPAAVAVSAINSVYSFFNQQDSITVQVTSPGVTVNQGMITFTDDGQKHTVPVSNGTASTTFTFPLAGEIPQPHSIGFSYSDPASGFATVNGQGSLPDTTFLYLYQIGFDLLLLQAIGL
jgi:hypothetical protein